MVFDIEMIKEVYMQGTLKESQRQERQLVNH